MKIISLIVMLLFVMSLVNVDAQNEITTLAELEQETDNIVQNEISDPELQDLGTTPDQAGYGLKIALERIRLALTLNKVKKVELVLKLAELRVREARLMVIKNKLEVLKKVKNEHKRYLDIAEKHIETLDTDEKAIKKHARIKVKLEEQKEEVDDLEALILIKARGLTDAQKEKLLALVEEFRKDNYNIEIKIESKKDILKTRLKAKGIKEEDIEIEYENERNETRNLTKEFILERNSKHLIVQA